jgi:hypothetical protein
MQRIIEAIQDNCGEMDFNQTDNAEKQRQDNKT